MRRHLLLPVACDNQGKLSSWPKPSLSLGLSGWEQKTGVLLGCKTKSAPAPPLPVFTRRQSWQRCFLGAVVPVLPQKTRQPARRGCCWWWSVPMKALTAALALFFEQSRAGPTGFSQLWRAQVWNNFAGGRSDRSHSEAPTIESPISHTQV